MDARTRHRLLIVAGSASLLAALGSSPPSDQTSKAVAASARAADSLPPGVTPDMVTKGRQLFTGSGLCIACHGPEGKGGVIGPNLSDATWLHGSGDYREIVRRVTEGALPGVSKTGQIMPPRGGAAINDEQIRAVAAFVWTLSRKQK